MTDCRSKNYRRGSVDPSFPLIRPNLNGYIKSQLFEIPYLFAFSFQLLYLSYFIPSIFLVHSPLTSPSCKIICPIKFPTILNIFSPKFSSSILKSSVIGFGRVGYFIRVHIAKVTQPHHSIMLQRYFDFF